MVNSRTLTESIRDHKIIYSDASSTACAAFMEGTTHIAHRMFTKSAQEKSSRFRELPGIQLAVEAFQPLITSCNVKMFTDSQMAVKITEVGSMKLEYHDIAICKFKTCFKANIQLHLQWIPRKETQKADYLSKLIDYDDWEVAPHIFHELDSIFGPHTVDCFANYQNYKIPRFFSRFWNPNSSGVGAFYQDWSQDTAWVVPPVAIIPRALIFMFQNKYKGTLLADTGLQLRTGHLYLKHSYILCTKHLSSRDVQF